MITLARGSTVIQSAERSIPDGAVAYDGERIEAVGPFDELRRRWPQAGILGGPDKLVMPGLANAHDHGRGASNWDRGFTDGPLETWRLEQQGRPAPDPYLQARYYGLQLLRSGVTTAVHMHLTGVPPGRLLESASAAVRAYKELGLRLCFALGAWDQQRIVLGPEEAFLATLPPDLAETVRAQWGTAVGLDETIAVAEDLTAEAKGSRVRIYVGPLATHWCSEPMLKALKRTAERLDSGFHIHLLETPYQKVWADRALGRPLVEVLDDWGLVDERFTGAHAVWLTDGEMEILARRGASISHDPSSNLRLRSGIARVPALLNHGVNVGIGLDGMSFREPDLFAEMRLALALGRPPGLDTPALDARTVFRLATQGGTRTALHRTDLGTLEPGQAADFVILDARLTPFTSVERDPADLALWRGGPDRVETVVVGGEVLVEHGRPTRGDIDETAAQLNAQLAEIESRPRDEAWLADLSDHARRFYADWTIPATDWANL